MGGFDIQVAFMLGNGYLSRLAWMYEMLVGAPGIFIDPAILQEQILNFSCSHTAPSCPTIIICALCAFIKSFFMDIPEGRDAKYASVYTKNTLIGGIYVYYR